MNKLSNLRKLPSSKIYLFEKDTNGNTGNTLKEFIYFLKFSGKSNINFSYASAQDSLHIDLSIMQNFELDSIPSSFVKDRENNISDFLSQLKNPHLKGLISELGDLDRKVKMLTSREVKLAALIKAILSMSEYIFLETPDSHIESHLLDKVAECIHFEANEKNRIVFVKSARKVLWPDIVTNIISKNHKNQYINSKNPLNTRSLRESTLIDTTRVTLKSAS